MLFGLICNSSVTGTEFHEAAGSVYIVLIAAHLVLNRKWIVAAAKRKLKGKRSVLMATINIALLIDFVVIFATGIRASHYIYPSAVKASSFVLVVHAAFGILAALLILAHVLVHAKAITKNKILPKVGLTAVLVIVIGYSIFGGVQGALHHGLPKDGGEKAKDERRIDNGDHQPKAGEKK